MDDAVNESDETITLSLTASAAYNLGATTSDTATIADNDTAGVTVTPTAGLTTTEASG